MEKKKHDNQNRKHNENLVLRNFKKEFDAIMIDIGLGPALTSTLDPTNAGDQGDPVNLLRLTKQVTSITV